MTAHAQLCSSLLSIRPHFFSSNSAALSGSVLANRMIAKTDNSLRFLVMAKMRLSKYLSGSA